MAKDNKKIIQRMNELMEPIDRQIMMCDNAEDVLMLASNMLITAKGIYVQNLGGAVTKILLQQIVDTIDDRILPLGGTLPPFDGK
jgi:hypothetical protein